VDCIFRVSNGAPELWDAETGIRIGAPYYRQTIEAATQQPCITISLSLAPASSIFVLFRKSGPLQGGGIVARNGTNYAGSATPTLPNTSGSAFVNDFCIAVWAQPETAILPGTSFLALPQDGVALYGAGHAVAGLAAGSNGVFLYEQSTGAPSLMLASKQPVSGWAHIAVVYRAGQPTMYINGQQAASGKASRFQIHAPLDAVTPASGPPKYFEGDMAGLEKTPPRGPEELRSIFADGPPASSLPAGLTMERSHDNQLRPIVWSLGIWKIAETDGIRKGFNRTCAVDRLAPPVTLTGPWTLNFPPGFGAPASVIMPSLVALNQHHDPPSDTSPEALSTACRFLSRLPRSRRRAPFSWTSAASTLPPNSASTASLPAHSGSRPTASKSRSSCMPASISLRQKSQPSGPTGSSATNRCRPRTPTAPRTHRPAPRLVSQQRAQARPTHNLRCLAPLQRGGAAPAVRSLRAGTPDPRSSLLAAMPELTLRPMNR
jgi:hypothetical protein